MALFLRAFTWTLVLGILFALWLVWMLLTHLPQIILAIVLLALAALVFGCELLIRAFHRISMRP